MFNTKTEMEFIVLIFAIIEISNRINISWKHTARLAFIENQIKTCVAIQSPVELEHWYAVLGIHLAKHGEEKRIRSHLDELLGTPDAFMMIDEDEPKKETILVRGFDLLMSCLLIRMDFHVKSLCFIFAGS